MDKEKGPSLPSLDGPKAQGPSKTRLERCNAMLTPDTRKKQVIFALWWIWIVISNIRTWRSFLSEDKSSSNSHGCPQSDVLTPQKNADLWNAMNAQIGTQAFKEMAVEGLARAVRIPTESFDDMDGIGVDPRWDAFRPFHEYLERTFPLVHATLKQTKVNTYGLHYEWKGSDSALKPILLAAHQDVVPVEPMTVERWKYPPYSGYYDGERIWGRGSADDKNGLVGMLIAIEALIAAKFNPTRTVVLSFGFDEEASGLQGAGHLGPYLEKIYGENGFAMIVDEGDGFMEQFGTVMASPSVAEKGYMDVRVEVTTPGGHSSVPPAHTSIGILAALLVQYEQNPTEVHITRHEPIYNTLQCFAEHGRSVPAELRKTIEKSADSEKALDSLQDFVRSDTFLSSLVRTTQAIDLIYGGVKSNALPEQAWAIVNHRVAVVSSLHEVKARNTDLLVNFAEKFNLTYVAFGKTIFKEGSPSGGTLSLSDAFGGGLEPAPITPTSGNEAEAYRLLSGTIKAAFNAHRSIDDPNAVIIAPGMLAGNTDTCSYWRLSRHIFRYNHHNAAATSSALGGIHTVNESLDVDSFLEMIRFFTILILNADESASL